MKVNSIAALVRTCMALGAGTVGTLSPSERALANEHSGEVDPGFVRSTRAQIRRGADPLGEAYCSIRSPQQRRPLGQTYTPDTIINSMVSWAEGQQTPTRIVDPGAGSGRYLLAAARAFPDAEVVGLDIDPLAGLMIRANAAAAGVGSRLNVVVDDYRNLQLPEVDGPTLFIGNPPYVRHHQIADEWKTWLAESAIEFGLRVSKLAGLHVHFFLATAQYGRPGDYGAFITSSEWLDVNYGAIMRNLLLGPLGGTEIHILEPEASPFADANTTGAITTFCIGTAPQSLKLRRVPSVSKLGSLGTGRKVSRTLLAESNRWSVLTRTQVAIPEGYVELGELVRVHRGAVTGANKVWVTRPGDVELPPSVLFPSVTRAHELFAAGDRLTQHDHLKRVIDLPVDLDELEPSDRKLISQFLREAKKQGVPTGYVASARKAWWSVGLRNPAPILATYMARRPPAFVRNDAKVRHINIAHGLYPREPLPEIALNRIAAHLRTAVTLAEGRTYAGGLTKFEPKEMERLTIPSLETLLSEDGAS